MSIYENLYDDDPQSVAYLFCQKSTSKKTTIYAPTIEASWAGLEEEIGDDAGADVDLWELIEIDGEAVE